MLGDPRWGRWSLEWMKLGACVGSFRYTMIATNPTMLDTMSFAKWLIPRPHFALCQRDFSFPYNKYTIKWFNRRSNQSHMRKSPRQAFISRLAAPRCTKFQVSISFSFGWDTHKKYRKKETQSNNKKQPHACIIRIR